MPVYNKQTIKRDLANNIVEVEDHVFKKVTPDEFCQIYLKDNEAFFTLNQSEYRVLSMCWLRSSYCEETDIGNKIIINKLLRKEICEKTKLTEGTVKNTILSLVKKDMLIKDDTCKGVYYLNPKYFYKGSISDRTKKIRKVIEYQF